MLHCPEPTKERVELKTISITAIEIPCLTRFTLPLLIQIQHKMWRNHHATTILNFLVAQIAAMNLIQFDFDKSGNCPDTVMKNALPLTNPLFQRPGWSMPLLFSCFLASFSAYTVF